MKVAYLSGMEISAGGLAAQRRQMDVAAENLANLQTTRTETGEPYRRKMVTLRSTPVPFARMVEAEQGTTPGLSRTHPAHETGARVSAPSRTEFAQGVTAMVTEDRSEFPTVYDPGHPDADAEGMVRMPNVNLAHEMVSLLMASRAYEANIAALQASQTIAEAGLNLAR